ncbi:hypothetical protein [Streptomyces sp. NPDC048516]|uniref:hypothetical protein n=1 Tax=Streptomyces sp. NPDC048516 TaxID=3365565 RepID=UPI00371A452D
MPTPAGYLEVARTENDSSVLHRLARSPYPFVRRALAANPHTAPDTLLELGTARDSAWNDSRLLRLPAEHPRADRTVLRARRLAMGGRRYDTVFPMVDFRGNGQPGQQTQHRQ